MTARYEQGGRKPCDDPLLVLLKKWPAREEFCENPRLIEGQVCLQSNKFIFWIEEGGVSEFFFLFFFKLASYFGE